MNRRTLRVDYFYAHPLSQTRFQVMMATIATMYAHCVGQLMSSASPTLCGIVEIVSASDAIPSSVKRMVTKSRVCYEQCGSLCVCVCVCVCVCARTSLSLSVCISPFFFFMLMWSVPAILQVSLYFTISFSTCHFLSQSPMNT